MSAKARLIALFITLLPLGVFAGEWNFLPIDGGRINDLVILPDRLVAATKDGIYVSLDAGDHWQRYGGLPRFTSVGELRIDATAPNRWFAIAFVRGPDRHNRLFRSLDAGNTWSQIDFPPDSGSGEVLQVELHPLSPGFVLIVRAVGGYFVVQRSLDGGDTWSSVQQYFDVTLPLLDAPGHWVGDLASESNDAGASWHAASLTQSLPDVNWLSLRTSRDFYPNNSYLYAAYDKNFAQQSPSPPPAATPFGRIDLGSGAVQPFSDDCNCTHTQVIADPHHAGRLLSGAVHAGDWTSDSGDNGLGLHVRESVDNGQSWHEIARLTNDAGSEVTIHADPYHANRFYVPTWDIGVLRSDNGGAGFSPRIDGLSMAAIRDLSVDPRDPKSFVVARSGLSLALTHDGGQTFQEPVSRELPHDMGIVARASDRPDRLLAHDRYYGTFRSDDAGTTWHALQVVLPAGEPAGFYRILSVGGNGQRFVATTANMTVMSADGGVTWTQMHAGGLSPTTARFNPHRVYGLAWGSNTLFVSDNFGGAYRALPAQGTLKFYFIAVHPYDDSILLAWRGVDSSSANFSLWRSEDAGGSWTKLRDGKPGEFGNYSMIIDACDERTVWVDGLELSRDGGRTFRHEKPLIEFAGRPVQNLCVDGKSFNFTSGPGGALQVRTPEPGDSLFRDSYES